MNPVSGMKKICAFGLLGALGCLGGWGLGEVFLALALKNPQSEQHAPSLASMPADIVLTPVSQAAPPPLETTPQKNVVADLPPPIADVAAAVSEVEAPSAFVATSEELAPPPELKDVASDIAPPPPAEFKARLERFGAKTGDIQISLLWNNINDIDLHCIDPNGEMIYFSHRQSRSGGQLDVDKNAGNRNLITNPVENIFWPTGRAPQGRYRVFVNHYRNQGARDPTDYEVSVLSGTTRKKFTGRITYGDQPHLVYEFTFGSNLQMAVPEKIVVLPGGGSRMQVSVARKRYKGPVKLEVEGDLQGLQVDSIQLSETEYKGLLTIRADAAIGEGAREIVVVALGNNGARGEGKVRVEVVPSLRIAASPEVVVSPATTTGIGVRIARGGLSGPVKLHCEGDVAGLSIAPIEIAANTDIGKLNVDVPAGTALGSRRLKIIAAGGTAKAEADIVLKLEPPKRTLHVSLVREVTLIQDSAVRVGMNVLRGGFSGPVVLECTGDLRGLRIPPVVVPGDKNVATFLITAESGADVGRRELKLSAAAGPTKAEQALTVRIDPLVPLLFVTASSDVSVIPGTTNAIRARAGRIGFTGPVKFHLEGELAGMSCHEAEIAENVDDALLEFSADSNCAAGMRILKLVGRSGKLTAEARVALEVKDQKPVLHLAIAPEIIATPGTASGVPVRIARERFAGPVEVFAESKLAGIESQPIEISADAKEAQLPFRVLNPIAGRYRGRIIARSGLWETAADYDVLVPEATRREFSWRLALTIGIWTGLLAIGISCALAAAQKWYLSRRLPSARQTLGLVGGGMTAGIVAGGAGQSLFGVLENANVAPEIGFLFGWGLLGGLLGRGVCFFIPNLNGLNATVAGVIGGMLGAGAFIGVSSIGDFAGRCVGAAILGGCLGLVVAIVEAAFRDSWLEVMYGGNEMRTVNLGAEPILIGAASNCNIWTRTKQPVALRFWIDQGRICRHDVADDVTAEVEPGHNEKVGTLEVFVRSGKAATPSVVGSPTAARAAAPPPPPPPPPSKSASKSPSWSAPPGTTDGAPAGTAAVSPPEPTNDPQLEPATTGANSSTPKKSVPPPPPPALKRPPPPPPRLKK